MKIDAKRIWQLMVTAIIGAAVLTGSQVQANPPDKMSYQGFLVDANGQALGNSAPRNYDVQFRIFDASQAGTLLWSEQQTVTVDKGYFSVLLGEGSQVGTEPHENLADVFKGQTAAERFVGITVKIPGSPDLEILPRLRLLTSPFAFLSQRSMSLVSTGGEDVISAASGAVGIKTATPASELEVVGRVTATAFTGNGAELTALNANNVSTGELHVDRVPNLPPGKIPNLDAGKITTGTLSAARLPNHSADLLTSGTVQDGRLSGNIPRLAANQTWGGANTYNGNVTVNSSVSFGSQARQMLNLWSTTYGIGIQNQGMYFRVNGADNDYFAWHAGGTHSNTARDAGGGWNLMELQARSFTVFLPGVGNVPVKYGNLKVNGYLAVDRMDFGDYRNVQWNDGDNYLYYDNSSRRYKENITTLDEDFAKILELRPTRYTRPGKPNRWEVGLIAEEVEETGLKRLVEYNKNGEVDGVNYEKLTVYLIGLAKQQQAEIKDLKASQESVRAESARQAETIAELQSSLEALEKRFTDLANKLAPAPEKPESVALLNNR